MKEVILHIGLHKTGSTSIQTALKGYNKNGVKSIAFKEANHSIPMFTIFSNNRYKYHIWKKQELSKDDIDKKRNEYLDILKKELRNEKVKTLIISGEDLSSLNDHEVKVLSEFLNAEQVSTTIVCYVRHPLSWAASAVQELAKNGNSFPNLDNFFKVRLGKYIEFFGKKNMKVFDYQKSSTKEKSVVKHFSKILSIDLKDPPRANESLSALQFSLIRNLNKLNLQKTRHRARDLILSHIMRIESTATSQHSKKVNEQYFVNLITKSSIEDCNWLNKEFGIQYKINKSKVDENLDDYFKIILSNSLKTISNLFVEIGISYDPIISLQDNFLNAYIFIETGIDNFNGDLYLELNPDIKAARVNPYKHFLENGIDIGRRFR